jgi:hypothetical protein
MTKPTRTTSNINVVRNWFFLKREVNNRFYKVEFRFIPTAAVTSHYHKEIITLLKDI